MIYRLPHFSKSHTNFRQIRERNDQLGNPPHPRTHGDVYGVAVRGAHELSGEAPLHPVAADVAALLERLNVGERQLRPQLRVVGPLRDQRYGHALPVQVEVADVVPQLDAAAKTDGLAGSEHRVWGEQSESGDEEGVCGGKEEDWHQKCVIHNNSLYYTVVDKVQMPTFFF